MCKKTVMVNKFIILLSVYVFVFPTTSAVAQTSKITGRVTSADTRKPLPGANVLLVGTDLGTTTDEEGYYRITNVPIGSYYLQITFVGYARTIVEDVKVNTYLTTTINFSLKPEVLEGQEVTIFEAQPVIQLDVASNLINVDTREVENLPVVTIEDLIRLQSGIEPDLRIRGGELNSVGFLIDGINLRDGRNNVPFIGLSYTAFNQMKVQTGGFNAEYGNVRAGLIQVSTKDPSVDRYTADILVRYRPPQLKNFGGSPKDPDAYWIRPYTDPNVSLTGTSSFSGPEGPWDRYTRRQYPFFMGWENVATNLTTDSNPKNDLTSAQLQEVFAWHTRKPVDINNPDYDIDMTIGGPLIPGISKSFGNLRFLASYRQRQEPYLYPQERDAYKDNTVQFKLISEIKPGLKLTLSGLYGNQRGMTDSVSAVSRGRVPFYPWSSQDAEYGRETIFTDNTFALSNINHKMVTASFLYTLSSKTFSEVKLHRLESNYLIRPGRPRDPTILKIIDPPGYKLDEAPFGWSPRPASSPGSNFYISGHSVFDRDTSTVVVWSGKFDITRQITRQSLLKAGMEYIYSTYDVKHGLIDDWIHIQLYQNWTATPIQGAAYLQNALELNGMVANLGLRLDYFYPGGKWFVYDRFERGFTQTDREIREEKFELKDTDRQFALSPRLGVSFPITHNSKLYFNYGHFRQMLQAQNLFGLQEFGITATKRSAITGIGNPNHPMPRTVANELGYEHYLFEWFLLQISGYSRSIDNQTNFVTYRTGDGMEYTVALPLNYNDVRGLEFTLSKVRGRFFRGFINYTYMSFKSGNFGFGTVLQHPLELRQYLRESQEHYKFESVTQPYGYSSLEFMTPVIFGPTIFGGRPLSDWRLNLLGEWRSGRCFNWSGPIVDEAPLIEGFQYEFNPKLENNTRTKDFYRLDMRLGKKIKTKVGSLQFFIDVNNILNLKFIYLNGAFESPPAIPFADYNDYMMSLHLPKKTFRAIEESEIPYLFIPGNDRPGHFRKEGVAFVPIEVVANAASLPKDPGYLESDRQVLYYLHDKGSYKQYVDGVWRNANQEFVNQVLEDKAYIDMPNEKYNTFLNPRSVIFGIRFSF